MINNDKMMTLISDIQIIVKQIQYANEGEEKEELKKELKDKQEQLRREWDR